MTPQYKVRQAEATRGVLVYRQLNTFVPTEAQAAKRDVERSDTSFCDVVALGDEQLTETKVSLFTFSPRLIHSNY